MHVLRRPHVPHAIGVSIAAALLAIAITLFLASALGDGTRPAGVRTLAGHRSPAAISATRTVPAPRWATDPFASLLSRPLPRPWEIAPR